MKKRLSIAQGIFSDLLLIWLARSLVLMDAIPPFGVMILAVIAIFIVPTLFCWLQERKI